MDKHGKNMILTKQDDEWREQHHNDSGMKEWNETNEWTKKWQLLPQLKLKSILTKSDWMELLENQQRKE